MSLDSAVLPDLTSLEFDPVEFPDIFKFYRLCCAVKNDIALTLPAKWGVVNPPDFLPPTVRDFLMDACNFSLEKVLGYWTLLKDHVWNEGMLPETEIQSLFVKHGSQQSLSYKSLYPPNSCCITPGCEHRDKLLKKANIREVVIITLGEGALSGWSVHLYCDKCKTTYHNNFMVNAKKRTYYRGEVPAYIEVSEHRFIEQRVIEMWISAMLRQWASASGLAETYNETLSEGKGWNPSWTWSRNLRTQHVWDGFTVLSLIEDCHRRHRTLVLPDDGDQADRYTEAVRARNDHFSVVGQPECHHYCTRCTRFYPEDKEKGLPASKTSMVVIDGVVIGHYRCSQQLDNGSWCKNYLNNNRNRFCAEHHESRLKCVVVGCKERAITGFKTCNDKVHRGIEDKRNQEDPTMHKMKERLEYREAAAKRQASNVHEDSDSETEAEVDEEVFEVEVPADDNQGKDGEKTKTGNKKTKKETKTTKETKVETIKAQFTRRRTACEQTFLGSCGMIFARETFFNHESPSSVIEMFLRVYSDPRLRPEHACYDTACKISRMVKDRKEFDFVTWTVDIFHFLCKHAKSDDWCQDHCNQYKYPELLTDEGKWFFNTSIAEQTNAWLKRYLSMLREMRGDRYEFFLDEMILRRNARTKEQLIKAGCKPGIWDPDMVIPKGKSSAPGSNDKSMEVDG